MRSSLFVHAPADGVDVWSVSVYEYVDEALRHRLVPMTGRSPKGSLRRRGGRERSPISTISMTARPARRGPEPGALDRPTAKSRRLVDASLSPNTRRVYAGALRQLDAWLDGRGLDDVTLSPSTPPPGSTTRGGRRPAPRSRSQRPRSARVLAGHRRPPPSSRSSSFRRA